MSSIQYAAEVRRTTRRTPSTAWYWLAVLVMLAGIATGVAWGVTSTIDVHRQAVALPRTSLPGAVRVPLQAGADSLVYFEGDGRPSLESLDLTVTAPDGGAVAVHPYDLVMMYEIGGWAGTPVASFSAPKSGTYTVAAGGRSDGHVAVGSNFVRSQALDIVGALLLIAVALAAGLVIIVVVAVQRSRRPAPAPSRTPSS